MRTETKQFFTKFIAGAILLGVIVFLLFFVVKGVRAHDNESQKYYDNNSQLLPVVFENKDYYEVADPQ